MGSPAFSVPILRALNEHFHVAGVVTQPDRPKGRGQKVIASPVKQTAEDVGIPVVTPARLRKDREAKEQIAAWLPDVIVVAAFGQILKKDILELPPFGCVNVHTSLLPRWRGASPIESAILAGDEETGVTIMRMDEGLDTGPILSQQKVPIPPICTSGELEIELAKIGADLLVDTLEKYLCGDIEPISQPEIGITRAPLISKEDGLLTDMENVMSAWRKVRAYQPWPGVSLLSGGQILKIIRAIPCVDDENHAGKHAVIDGKPAIGLVNGWLVLDEVHPAGKKPMSGEAFLRGYRQQWLEPF